MGRGSGTENDTYNVFDYEPYFIVFESEWQEWILAVDLLSPVLWITRLIWSSVPGVFTRNRTVTKKDASNPLVRAKPVRERRQHATCYRYRVRRAEPAWIVLEVVHWGRHHRVKDLPWLVQGQLFDGFKILFSWGFVNHSFCV